MTEKEIEEYLKESAPLWTWSIEGQKIRGTTLINSRVMTATNAIEDGDGNLFPFSSYSKMDLDAIIDAFKEGKKRKDAKNNS